MPDPIQSPDVVPEPAPVNLAESLPLAADQIVREGVSLGVNPETEGKLIQASARTGLPRDVLRDHQDFQVEDLMQQDARVRAYRRNLGLSAWVAANPGYADVSRGDETALERVRHATSAWLDMARSAPTTAEKWSRGIKEVGLGLSGGLAGLSRAGYGTLSWAADAIVALAGERPEDDPVSRVLRDLTDRSTVEQMRADLGGLSMDRARKDIDVVQRSGVGVTVPGTNIRVTLGDIAGGGVSLAPTLAAGAATGGALWAVLGAAAVQSAGGMYADLRERGDDVASASWKAALSGSITAALTAAFPSAEKGIAGLLRAAPDKKVAARLVFAKVLGERAAGEAGEESLDEFAQAIIRGDSLGTAVEAGVKAGLIGGVLGASVGIGEARTAHRTARAEGAEAFHKSVDSLVKEIDASKTMERSPEVMKSFLQASRPELKNAPAVFAAEDLKPLMEDPTVAEHLLAAGITKDAVDAAAESGGVVRSTQEKILLDLPAETREKVRPLMRESADAMSRPESEAALEETKAARQQSEVDEEAKRTLRLIKKEQTRISKEIQKASRGAMVREDIQKHIDLLTQFAYTMATRDAAAGVTALSRLQKITFAPDENLTPAEVRQRITNLAGPEGKTALRGIRLAADLGTVAGRVDLLTGQVTINPSALVDQRQVDQLLAQARGKTLDLAGKTITRQDGTEVDAGAEVDTLRSRLESAQRLVDCLSKG